jgi:hypothetical protein
MILQTRCFYHNSPAAVTRTYRHSLSFTSQVLDEGQNLIRKLISFGALRWSWVSRLSLGKNWGVVRAALE